MSQGYSLESFKEDLEQNSVNFMSVAAERDSGGAGLQRDYSTPLKPIAKGNISTRSREYLTEISSLSRHGTLLSVGAAPGRNTSELKSLLGNSNARLKHGAAVLPTPGVTIGKTCITSIDLEQAKPRARVELDVILQSKTCVQGSHFKGYVRINIRKRTKKEFAISLADGKVRVVGFECIPNEADRHMFYQCMSPLSEAAPSYQKIFASSRDEEGFAEGREGSYTLPFAIYLPIEDAFGNAKGSLKGHSGTTLRYIVMVSIKIKNMETDKRSIAHFYRSCEIWPRLNPSVVLAPAPKPLEAVASKILFMGGSGEVRLTAALHRLYWIAGQQCYIFVNIKNDTKKKIKSLTVALLRTTIVFKPRPHLDALYSGFDHTPDPDACQTSTVEKIVAETTLEMGQRATRSHASAKGWWIGVGSGEDRDISHFILLPSDALSVTRGRLLEVQYKIRVSISAGTLASDVHVTLPIQIINFLSIDPPPSSSLPSTKVLGSSECSHSDTAQFLSQKNRYPLEDRQNVYAIDDPKDLEAREESPRSLENSKSLSGQIDKTAGPELGPLGYEDSFEGALEGLEQDALHLGNDTLSHEEAELGNMSLQDDADDMVQLAIASARIDAEYEECAPRFADLYYSSAREDLREIFADRFQNSERELYGENGSEFDRRADVLELFRTGSDGDHLQDDLDSGISNLLASTGPLQRPNHQRGLSSFQLRVQEKLQATTIGGNYPLISDGNPDLSQSGLSHHTGVFEDPDLDLSASELSGTSCRHEETPDTQTRNCSTPTHSRSGSVSGSSRYSGSIFETSYPSGNFGSAPPLKRPEGSRLLPKPPTSEVVRRSQAISLQHQESVTDILEFPLPPSNIPLLENNGPQNIMNVGSVTAAHRALAQVESHSAPQRSPNRNQGLGRTDSDTTPSPTKVGAVSSVKDKIRELEERARACGY